MRRGVAKGLRAVVVNPSVILGVGDWQSGGSTLIIPFVAGGIPFYTTGVMGYVDVRDVARAMVLLSREPKAVGERFILSSENISYKDFISLAAAYAGRRKPWIRAGRRILTAGAALDKLYSWITGSQPQLTAEVISNAVGKSYYDGSKVTRYVDFKYTPVGDTIRRVVKDYIEHHE